MDKSKSIIEVLWTYLRPRDQLSLLSTCSNIRRWGLLCGVKLPDLESLHDQTNWKDWYDECLFDFKDHNNMYLWSEWRWSYNSIRIRVLFRKTEDYLMLLSIKAHYYITNTIFQSIQILVWSDDLIIDDNNDLSANKDWCVYEKYCDIIKSYNNSKCRSQLFPYCKCMFSNYIIPGAVVHRNSIVNGVAVHTYLCGSCTNSTKFPIW